MREEFLNTVCEKSKVRWNVCSVITACVCVCVCVCEIPIRVNLGFFFFFRVAFLWQTDLHFSFCTFPNRLKFSNLPYVLPNILTEYIKVGGPLFCVYLYFSDFAIVIKRNKIIWKLEI